MEMNKCPFCGMADCLKMTTTTLYSSKLKFYFVSCPRCGADGPHQLTEDNAVKLWNSARQKENLDKIEALKEQVERLAAENAALKKSGTEFFTYCNELGFERYSDKELAIADAQSRVDACREEAVDGWTEDVESICWGVIIQQAVECNHQFPAEDNGWLGSVDYKLSSLIETPATSAVIGEPAELLNQKHEPQRVGDMVSSGYVGDGDTSFLKEHLADGWTEWNGGDCPVPSNAVVEVITADSGEEVGEARIFYWHHLQKGCDIIAYRVCEGDK